MQKKLSAANKTAWETKAYQAWERTYGTPEALAKELKRTHKHLLRYWLKYIGDPAGRRVLNLLGSNGRKAVSLALMGAAVTVVDISEENHLYAMRTAEAAGVRIDYLCADATDIPDEEKLGQFDIVLMEFGILHYFAELDPIFSTVCERLKPGGRLLLTDFHPFARIWKSFEERRTPGDYFDRTFREGDVAFAQLLPEEDRGGLNKVMTRGWTVGDIIAAISKTGLLVRAFEEFPASSAPGLPEFYTLVADKIEAKLPPLHP
ncbi:class I SAM-dependent methyltransferase [Cohnella cellulosilytica]|uniref:Class I SAM-dependent methyltransferase n=1 Tax=Cohnella cellulosilytica TaxID=986710 RepID=A0ABW2FCC6_9BACL